MYLFSDETDFYQDCPPASTSGKLYLVAKWFRSDRFFTKTPTYNCILVRSIYITVFRQINFVMLSCLLIYIYDFLFIIVKFSPVKPIIYTAQQHIYLISRSTKMFSEQTSTKLTTNVYMK